MKTIRHPKCELLSKVDLIAFQLRYILRPKVLNDTELMLLAYIFLYRHKAIDVSLKEGRLPLKNRNSVSNMITGFRKDGLVHGTGKKTKLHPHIKPILDDISFTIEFKLLRDDPLDKGKVTREREEADVV